MDGLQTISRTCACQSVSDSRNETYAVNTPWHTRGFRLMVMLPVARSFSSSERAAYDNVKTVFDELYRTHVLQRSCSLANEHSVSER